MMKKTGTRVTAILVMAFLIIAVAAGCGGGNIGDDMAQDLGEGLAEGLSGGNISNDNKWPEELNKQVPQMKTGDIVNSTAITVGGKTNVTITMENVSESAHADYIADVEAAGFNVVVSSQSGGIDSRTFSQGENVLSVQYADKSDEMIISYTGD